MFSLRTLRLHLIQTDVDDSTIEVLMHNGIRYMENLENLAIVAANNALTDCAVTSISDGIPSGAEVLIM